MRSILLFSLLFAIPASAQEPADVPRDHWAYQSVEELAARGLIKGYPPDGNFFGKRTVTRYELASIIKRVIEQVDSLCRQTAKSSSGLPTDQLEEIRMLANEFKTELVVIGADLKKLQDQIGDLSKEIAGLRKSAERGAANVAAARADISVADKQLKQVRDSIAKTKATIAGPEIELRAHKISGYIQARFEAMDT